MAAAVSYTDIFRGSYTGPCRGCRTKSKILTPNILKNYNYECRSCIERSVQQAFDHVANTFRHMDNWHIFNTQMQISPFRHGGTSTAHQAGFKTFVAIPSPQQSCPYQQYSKKPKNK